MTLLTFRNKYVITSTTPVSTTSTDLVDDTEAVVTFTLDSPKVVLVIYQVNSVYGATVNLRGIQNAINIDGNDRANSWDSPDSSNYPVRNCIFWVGILTAGSHTIKGRFATINPTTTVTINNRVLLVYIFNGNEFYYIDDATATSIASITFVDDPYAQITFTPSAPCKALIMYNISNSFGSTEPTNGKKSAININGVDYAQAEKCPYSTNYPDSIFTVYALSLPSASTTVKGRFASHLSADTVTISRRQLAVLLFSDSTLLDIVDSTVQVSTTSNTLVDDPQAIINRTITDTRELLVIAMGTKRRGTKSSAYGECYGINIDGNDRANSRGSPYDYDYANSVATAYGEQLVAGSHTIKGRFSNNYGTETAKIDARVVVALWFSLLPPLIETIVSQTLPMNYLAKPLKAEILISKVEGATITETIKVLPEILIKKNKAQELINKFS